MTHTDFDFKGSYCLGSATSKPQMAQLPYQDRYLRGKRVGLHFVAASEISFTFSLLPFTSSIIEMKMHIFLMD